MEEEHQELVQIGKKVKILRTAKGQTLQGLAKEVDLSASMISQIENSKLIPTCQTLFRLSRALGVSMGFFFEPGAVSVTVQVDKFETNSPEANSAQTKPKANEANQDEAIRGNAKEKGTGVSGVSAVSGVEAT